MNTENELVRILKDAGYEVAEGFEATLQMIKNKADNNTQMLCSGYGVFPGGDKCYGCSDCRPKIYIVNSCD